MSKFKVGDRIRPIESEMQATIDHWNKYWASKWGAAINGEFYVLHVYSDGRNIRYGVKMPGDGPCADSDEFELVVENGNEPFITTIPPQPAKRVLKAYSFQTSYTKANVSIETYTSADSVEIEIDNQMFEAEDIAELIAFLTKVNEVLKENENAA